MLKRPFKVRSVRIWVHYSKLKLQDWVKGINLDFHQLHGIQYILKENVSLAINHSSSLSWNTFQPNIQFQGNYFLVRSNLKLLTFTFSMSINLVKDKCFFIESPGNKYGKPVSEEKILDIQPEHSAWAANSVCLSLFFQLYTLYTPNVSMLQWAVHGLLSVKLQVRALSTLALTISPGVKATVAHQHVPNLLSLQAKAVLQFLSCLCLLQVQK